MDILFAKKSLVLGLFFLAGIASNSRAQDTKPAPPTPIDEKKVELGHAPWESQWDEIIEKALPAEMLSSQVPKDVLRFCPRFYGMDETSKRAFWAYFFQALAGAEAGLNPTSSVRHPAPEATTAIDAPVPTPRTEGLLQLEYADHKRYGCDFDRQADRGLKATDPAKTILQPKNNLECGVKILFNQIIVHHKPLLTHSSYWEPLRPAGPTYRIFAKQMTNPPASCGLSTKSDIDKAATTKSVEDNANVGEAPK